MSQETAAASLVDVIVLAEMNKEKLAPLTPAPDPRANSPGLSTEMLPICNRPLIWYSIRPWVEAGFPYIFVCTSEDDGLLRPYLRAAFPQVHIHYVYVPATTSGKPSTSCDAVRAYLDYKEWLRQRDAEEGDPATPPGPQRDRLREERAALEGRARDAVLVSCESVLAGVDVTQFVNRFYYSLASVAAMFFRPLAREDRPEGKDAGGGKKRGPPSLEPKPFVHAYSCIGYEEDNVVADMTTGAPAEEAEGSPLHHRLHFLSPLDDGDAKVSVTMAFAARRPNLTFAADVVDMRVHVVRQWVLPYIARAAGDSGASVHDTVVPQLAMCQHTTVNLAAQESRTPDEKIDFAIPTHWLYAGREVSIDALNAARGTALPPHADNLRVFATIYEERADLPCKLYRVDSSNNYTAINQELLESKVRLELPGGEGGQAAPAAAGARTAVSGVMRPSMAVSLWSDSSRRSAGALAAAVPHRPFTLKEKKGDHELYILTSFVDGAPTLFNARVIKSIVGPGVVLGKGAIVRNSVLQANVEIGADCTVEQSVLGTGAIVAAGTSVKQCVVAPWCHVEGDVSGGILE